MSEEIERVEKEIDVLKDKKRERRQERSKKENQQKWTLKEEIRLR